YLSFVGYVRADGGHMTAMWLSVVGHLWRLFLVGRRGLILLQMLFQRLFRRFFSALREGVRPDLRALPRALIAFGNLLRRSFNKIVERGRRLRVQPWSIRICWNIGEFVLVALHRPVRAL